MSLKRPSKRTPGEAERMKRLGLQRNPFALISLNLSPCGHKRGTCTYRNPSEPCLNPPSQAELSLAVEEAALIPRHIWEP